MLIGIAHAMLLRNTALCCGTSIRDWLKDMAKLMILYALSHINRTIGISNSRVVVVLWDSGSWEEDMQGA
jgi:hypothetical protein